MSDSSEFIDPSATAVGARIAPAPRPIDLSGKIVGLLDNTKEQADVILATLGEALQRRYGVKRIVTRRKEHYSKPATGALIDAMAREVQVAIAAVGG